MKKFKTAFLIIFSILVLLLLVGCGSEEFKGIIVKHKGKNDNGRPISSYVHIIKLDTIYSCRYNHSMSGVSIKVGDTVIVMMNGDDRHNPLITDFFLDYTSLKRNEIVKEDSTWEGFYDFE